MFEKYFLVDFQWKGSENSVLRVEALQCNLGYDPYVLLRWSEIEALNVLIWIPLNRQTFVWVKDGIRKERQ